MSKLLPRSQRPNYQPKPGHFKMPPGLGKAAPARPPSEAELRELGRGAALCDLHKARTSLYRDGKKDHVLPTSAPAKRQYHDHEGIIMREEARLVLALAADDPYASGYRDAIADARANPVAMLPVELTPADHAARRNMGTRHEDNYQFKRLTGEPRERYTRADAAADRQGHAEYLALREECARIARENAERGKSYGGGSK